MLFPPGFYGTRADLLIDIVITSLVVIVPILVWSWSRVRRGDYALHRTVQGVLFAVLFVVVSIFELDLRMSGGIFEITRESRYAGTALLTASVYIHMCFSVSTAIIWVGLVASAFWKFDRPPRPNSFSRMHRFWGKVGMIDMFLTGVTGVELYVVGMAL